MEDPTKEEAYWLEHHEKQPFADKNSPYKDYAHAYRTGHEAAVKHSDKGWDEIETEIARDYESTRPEWALPWDVAHPAVRAAWDRLAGVTAPRDVDRGMRGSI